ncbi:unnamed protein product [Acanthoscelides obtectus]|uniref:Uncharacterized protein n=2 Tax=Acanthoscelides obtectus TaxID=200917 RepID=A0A9P0LAW3_ACAOB|nr:unnamed protein product [Acanthoscelides obtectus]CAK1637593.1 hypothetical protein AOBTE_LOCUS10074 [Acanthoscelides obtectus]
MKFFALFFVFAAISMSNVDADFITVAVNIILSIVTRNMERREYVELIPKYRYEFPKEIAVLAAGSLELKNIRLYGLKEAHKVMAAKDGAKDNSTHYVENVGIYLNVPEIFLELEYDADLGFVDEVPIYGTGNIRLQLSKLLLNLTTEVSINKQQLWKDITVEDLTLDFGFRHSSKSQITNFWRNKTVSGILSTTINILVELFSMWFNYEKECINCIVGESIQKAANEILHPKNEVDSRFDCECLRDLFKGKYKLEKTVETLITGYNSNQSFVELVSKIGQDGNVKRLYNAGTDEILKVLGDKGILEKLGM